MSNHSQDGPDRLVVLTAAHVDSGKSTLVGALSTGERDDGAGKIRSYLDVNPHEIERGLSADLSYALYGFDGNGDPIRLRNPTNTDDRKRIVDDASRVVSFVDGVGHSAFLSTEIRGVLGQRPDYALLTVAADEGLMQTTREHLGIILATETPVLVAITKSDTVSEDQIQTLRSEIDDTLERVGAATVNGNAHGVSELDGTPGMDTVPVFTTSAVTGHGLESLDDYFRSLPHHRDDSEKFRMYIDQVYSVPGVGAVVSGSVKSGCVTTGDELHLGPFPDGQYEQVTVRSIEEHYNNLESACAGQIVGIALKGVNTDDIDRGMALLPASENATATREFEADVTILNSPTRITSGYEPVVHLETIAESAVITPSPGRILPGQTAPTTIEFKFHPYLVEEGQRFVVREGTSRGVGTVTSVGDDA